MSIEETKKQPLLILAGPTASGKTALSVELAQALDGEIISADSMQVYRGMDVGTAKVRPEETEGVPHHLIDIIDPDEEWNVMKFQQLAKEKITEIAGRGHLPMIVGGTGFYIHALAYDAEFEEEPENNGLRAELEALPTEELFEQLKALDPESALKIHPNNRKRVIRAIEYAKLNEEPISQLNERLKAKESPYRLAFLVLDMPREELYERINRRVDLMLEKGLVEEVKALMAQGYTSDLVSMKGLGYKELVPCLQGETSPEEAVELLKKSTRHFAKRQMTWMRREEDAVFLPVYPRETLTERALEIAREKLDL